jgi:tRNA-2-methylthio-N6-dimethylallyladenosine synthase
MHLPAQAGSNAVLAAMNRGYSRDEYLKTITALKRACPSIRFTGDMIVGFPGETEEDFRATLSLMEEVRYDDLFSFIYSKRPETKAADYADPVGFAEKQERLRRLQSLQQRITEENNKSLVGTVQEVLIEGESRREGQFYGRTSGNRVVNFSADLPPVGSIVDVVITRANRNSLLGELTAG